jgi:hypothetical protein
VAGSNFWIRHLGVDVDVGNHNHDLSSFFPLSPDLHTHKHQAGLPDHSPNNTRRPMLQIPRCPRSSDSKSVLLLPSCMRVSLIHSLSGFSPTSTYAPRAPRLTSPADQAVASSIVSRSLLCSRSVSLLTRPTHYSSSLHFPSTPHYGSFPFVPHCRCFTALAPSLHSSPWLVRMRLILV